MEVNTALRITELMFMYPNPMAVEAVRLLRPEASLHLIDATEYLEANSKLGEMYLLAALQRDFCLTNEELLEKAKHDLKRLELHIHQLKMEISRTNGMYLYPLIV